MPFRRRICWVRWRPSRRSRRLGRRSRARSTSCSSASTPARPATSARTPTRSSSRTSRPRTTGSTWCRSRATPTSDDPGRSRDPLRRRHRTRSMPRSPSAAANGGGEAGGFQLLAKTIKNDVRHHVQRRRDRQLQRLHRHRQQARRRQHVRGRDDRLDPPRLPDSNPSKHAAPVQHQPEYRRADLFEPARHVRREPAQLRAAGDHAGRLQARASITCRRADALDFVRCRDGLVGTDYARQRHQQQFIKAVMQEAYRQGPVRPVEDAARS